MYYTFWSSSLYESIYYSPSFFSVSLFFWNFLSWICNEFVNCVMNQAEAKIPELIYSSLKC